MPAHNEERFIGKNLKAIRAGLEQGVIHQFVLVLDGCTDRTEAIACKMLGLSCGAPSFGGSSATLTRSLENGARIFALRFDSRQGKGAAFTKAVFALNRTDFFRRDNPVMVLIDADALDLAPTTAFRLAHDLITSSVPMMLGEGREKYDRDLLRDPICARERGSLVPACMAGFRAIHGSALQPMLNRDQQWVDLFPAGICMEQALNLLVLPPPTSRIDYSTPAVPRSKVPLLFAKAGRNVDTGSQEDLRQRIALRYSRLNPTAAKPEGIVREIEYPRALTAR